MALRVPSKPRSTWAMYSHHNEIVVYLHTSRVPKMLMSVSSIHTCSFWWMAPINCIRCCWLVQPQQSLMTHINSTDWKLIISTDLSQTFYRMSLAFDSMKCYGVVTPYHGVRGQSIHSVPWVCRGQKQLWKSSCVADEKCLIEGRLLVLPLSGYNTIEPAWSLPLTLGSSIIKHNVLHICRTVVGFRLCTSVRYETVSGVMIWTI